MFRRLKELYTYEFITNSELLVAVKKGWITEEEYSLIVNS